MDIRFVKKEQLKEKPDQKHLGFGKYMTDYMFVMDWWHTQFLQFVGRCVCHGLDGRGRLDGREDRAL